jgi:hypothetical protein
MKSLPRNDLIAEREAGEFWPVQRNSWFAVPSALVSPRRERKAHPQATPPDVQQSVIEFALNHPMFGCCKLAQLLKDHSIPISSPTIQKILIKYQLGSKRQRAARVLALAQQGRTISPYQMLQAERIMRTTI